MRRTGRRMKLMTRGWGATIQGAATMGEGSHAQEHGGARESGKATRLHDIDDVHIYPYVYTA